MIQKIVPARASFFAAVRYVLRPEKGHLLDAHHLTLGDHWSDYAEQLKTTAELRSTIEKPVFHASLRLPAGEALSDEQWSAVARDYMNRLGFEQAPYLVVRHTDQADGDHIHIIASRVSVDGKAISSSFERHRGLEVVKEVEERHHLRRVAGGPAPSDSRGVAQSDIHLTDRYAPTARATLQLNVAAARSEATSAPDFVRRLEVANIRPELHLDARGVVRGISYQHGGVSIRGSALGRAYTPKGLAQRGIDLNSTAAAAARLQYAHKRDPVATEYTKAGLHEAAASARLAGRGAFEGLTHTIRLVRAFARSPLRMASRALLREALGSQAIGLLGAVQSPQAAAGLLLRTATRPASPGRRARLAANERRELVRQVVAVQLRAATAAGGSPEAIASRLASAGILTESRGAESRYEFAGISFRARQLSSPPNSPRPTAGEQTVPAIASPPRLVPVGHRPAVERTPALVSAHLEALGGDRFDIAVRRPGASIDDLRAGMTRDGIEKLLPWLRRENANGSEVLIRPAAGRPAITLRDVDRSRVAAAQVAGVVPSVVVGTTTGSVDISFRLPPGTSTDVRRTLLPALEASIGGRFDGGFGRVAGFKTPNERFYAQLEVADGAAVSPLVARHVAADKQIRIELVQQLAAFRLPAVPAATDRLAVAEWTQRALQQGAPPSLVVRALALNSSPNLGDSLRAAILNTSHALQVARQAPAKAALSTALASAAPVLQLAVRTVVKLAPTFLDAGLGRRR